MKRTTTAFAFVCALPWIAPEPVSACTCAVTALVRSDPPYGETDVPVNQALVIEGWFVHGSVELRDDSGEAVEFEMNDGPSMSCMPGIAELIPKQPLKPNRGYVIEVQPEYDGDLVTERERTVRFTTGEASLAEEKLAPPKGRASVVVEEPSGFCGHPSGVLACVGTDDRSTQLEVIARAGEDILLRFLATKKSEYQFDAFYSLPQLPDCIELRHRSPTGRRSAPLSICGDELDLRMLSGDAYDLGVSCDEGTIRSEAPSGDMQDGSDAGAGGSKLIPDETAEIKGGCSASGHGSSAANWSWTLAGLFMLTGARRRSQGRRRSSTATNLT